MSNLIPAFAYDADFMAIGALGRVLALERSTVGYDITELSAEGRETVYRVELPETGERILRKTYPDGTQKRIVTGTDGTLEIEFGNGMKTRTVLGADPRWGMDAPMATGFEVETPGGLRAAGTLRRRPPMGITLSSVGVCSSTAPHGAAPSSSRTRAWILASSPAGGSGRRLLTVRTSSSSSRQSGQDRRWASTTPLSAGERDSEAHPGSRSRMV